MCDRGASTQMKTPLMLMIGAKDFRVPPKQSHEIRRALQARGTEVRYVTSGVRCYYLWSVYLVDDLYQLQLVYS